MRRRTRAAIIGGGIAGCSTLYHLSAVEGWSDVMLFERDSLTSGTTWHSAAQVTSFGYSQLMLDVKARSIALYTELSADPEDRILYHRGDGGIRLAGDERTMDVYRHASSVGRAMGSRFEILDAEECVRRHPLLSSEGLVGGLWDPFDGDVDPSQLCHALARRSRAAGAEIHVGTPVVGLTSRGDEGWIVHTEKGDVDADVIVNASGYRVHEVSAMMGARHPIASMEHQYFVTERIDDVASSSRRIPLVRCPISDFYARQEGEGLLLGFYEQDCRAWGMDGIDPSFSNALCPDDLDRVSDVFEGACRRMPVLSSAGIRRVVNGPITYSLDGLPLAGKVAGVSNAYCLIGLRAGVGEGGGLGALLAEIIVRGETRFDSWELDPRRFGAHANAELASLKAIEEYRNEFRPHFPHEHRAAGRPMRSTPLTSVLRDRGGRFAVVNGWERLDYVAPSASFSETLGHRFTESFALEAEETSAVRDGVGLSEINGMTRLEVSGRDAAGFLDRMVCGAIPSQEGRVGLGYVLTERGMLLSEATLTRLGADRFWYSSAASAEVHDFELLRDCVRSDEDVAIRSLTEERTILLLAGPRCRDVLSSACRGDWTASSFPWMRAREGIIGSAEAMILSVSFSGESAVELHVPTSRLWSAWEALHAAAGDGGLRLFGARAIDSMRIEKGFLHWKSDILTEHDPFEVGLERFVRLQKPEFRGKEALARRLEADGADRVRRVMLSLSADHAPAHEGAAILAADDDHPVGSVTSAAWGHRVSKNLAMGFVPPALSEVGARLRVEVIGEAVDAQVIETCPYDPKGLRMRS